MIEVVMMSEARTFISFREVIAVCYNGGVPFVGHVLDSRIKATS